MSETPETPPSAAPPASRNSPLAPPPPRRLDPAAVMIGVGGVVLLLAVWWLLVTPRSTNDASVDPARVAQLEQRLATLEGVRGELGTITGRLNALSAVEGRVQAVENRPAPAIPDVRPIESQLNGLNERLGAVDRRIAAVESRPAPAAPDLRPLESQVNALNERSAANDRRIAAVEGRPSLDPAAFAARGSLDSLTGRIDQLEAALNRRLQEIVAADEQREQAAQQAVTQKLAEAMRADEQREQAAQQAAAQRLQALEASLTQRIAALDQTQQSLRGQLARVTRLAAVDRLQTALAAGRPLAEGLGGIDQPPPALARFAQAGPPTLAGLRQSFEDAARAARDATVPGTQGGKADPVDSALARVGALLTVRRGDQVLWGDSIEPDLERARRALEAGDLEMSLQHVEKLPPSALAAMQSWVDQAKAVIAARAALRQLAAG